ncbi:MAG: hypothetical protein IKY23_01635 [Lachnospiraceae bacterium]|nr:hypothetical protein [Lachnospiraceae bacterium]
MSEYIKLKQDEYDELQIRLNSLHQDVLLGERSVRKDIVLLMQKDGGMYVQNISYKIFDLLSKLQTNVVNEMADCFGLSEKAIAQFANDIIQSDIINY